MLTCDQHTTGTIDKSVYMSYWYLITHPQHLTIAPKIHTTGLALLTKHIYDLKHICNQTSRYGIYVCLKNRLKYGYLLS